MLFNSLVFLAFLPVVFGAYWFVGGERGSSERLWLQNLLVVAASYVFYGWWDWRFLVLIAFTSFWAWASGIALTSRKFAGGGKIVVFAALLVNLGILGVFKYFNFFAANAAVFLNALGLNAHLPTLEIVLPVGISFYTFQALSYVIDVYRGDVKPTRDVVAFFAFVSFFPQLVAGPIERATNLLPQFLKPRSFDYALAVEGCRQMLWGFFKKVVVADSCAAAANALLDGPAASGVALWAGMICFTFQIYGDFSGYSDIAIGCAKLFGIRLMRNFNMPYFSRDIAEFWRRWHISLTTWFRDYLYIPLGGSLCSTAKKIRNTFAIFLVSGLWHGANWTFVAWGAFHAACFVPLLLLGKNRRYAGECVAEGRMLPNAKELAQIAGTFLLAVIGWTFFRAPDISTALSWLSSMAQMGGGEFSATAVNRLGKAAAPLCALVLIEWFNRGAAIPALPRGRALRWMVCLIALAVTVLYRSAPQEFIYFRF